MPMATVHAADTLHLAKSYITSSRVPAHHVSLSLGDCVRFLALGGPALVWLSAQPAI